MQQQKDLEFLCVLSFSKLSLLELSRLREHLNFELLASSENTALISCDLHSAKRLAPAAGGIFKIARVCGTSPEGLDDCLPLPDHSKFAWTVSSYGCAPDDLEGMKTIVQDLLKNASLGKARFVQPTSKPELTELKISDLLDNVLSVEDKKRARGLDVVQGCIGEKIHYGYTEFVSDVRGFYERDFGRPYQDPTITLGTRVARTLVNLCGLEKGKTILDPFCGLGTILQEALMAGYNVLGVEISSAEVDRCRENLKWLRSYHQISPKLSSRIVRGDSLRMEALGLPKVAAIATEPILMPKLERNETSIRSEEMIKIASHKYREAFRAFSTVLEPQGVVSIVSPDLIDDRGNSHSLDLVQIGGEFGLSPISSAKREIENPVPVPTTKKKIIQRKVFLFRRKAGGF